MWGTDQRFAKKIGERTLFVTHGESCSKISVDALGSISFSTVLERCSNQEEADTRMFLHALHSSDAAHQQILIKSSGTDVEVLACNFREYISADIFLLCGTRSRARVINVTQVCEQLGVEVYQALPGLHVLTGCDTVSSFAGKGKKAALDVVKADENSRASIHRIGECVPPIREDLRKMEKFVCSLYNDFKLLYSQRYEIQVILQKPECTVVPASSHPCCPIEASTTCKLPSLCLETCIGCKNSKPRTRWSRMVS